VTHKEDIETILLDRNKKHFNQANHTPFAKNNLLKTYGYKGVNKNSQNLIEEGIKAHTTEEETNM
jgi:hypothetical protein